MKLTKARYIIAFLFCLISFYGISQEKISRVKVFADNVDQRASLLALLEIDHFITDTDGGMISEIDESMLSKLKAGSYRYTIITDDVVKELDSLNKIFYAELKEPQKRVAIEQPGSTSAGIIITPSAFQVKPTLGGYYNFTEIEAAIDNLVAAYPAIASKTSIGITAEGRNIWVVKISDNVAVDETGEPELLYMGLQHCREAIGGSSMIFFMQYLCERYALDNRIKDLVNNREIFIIPCINPDGWEYNRTSMGGAAGGNWRKNRSVSGGGNFGVDLNRNWGIDWSNCNPPIMGSVTTCGSSDPAAQS
jgi:carboxypeptidase T